MITKFLTVKLQTEGQSSVNAYVCHNHLQKLSHKMLYLRTYNHQMEDKHAITSA